jgi:hypothetical protein
MAAATLDMKIVSATLSKNTGASTLTTAGTTTLTLVIEAVADAASVPLNVASDSPSKTNPADAKGLIDDLVTMTYDDTTGVLTSIVPT